MKNTPYAISEASSLVAKLLVRTEEGKIGWSESEFYPADTESFEVDLEGAVKVRISSDRSALTLDVVIKKDQGPDRRILEVSLQHDPHYGYDLPGEEALYKQLFELNDLARRSAFNVDQNLASTMDYLERLAG